MPDVELVRDGPVAVLTINRPERANSLTAAMIERTLPAAWEEVEADPAIRCVLLTATESRFFCAGMDLYDPALAAGLDSGAHGGPPATLRVTGRQCGVSVPVVTAVGGLCLGGGLMFLADADVAIASTRAAFGNPGVSVGQVATVGPAMLAKRGAFVAAMRMTLLGTAGTIGAAEAVCLGLVSEVVPHDRLLDRGYELAGAIAAASPAAVREARRNLWATLDLGMEEAVETARVVSARSASHPDAAEGRAAFAARRSPRWDRPTDG